MTVNTKVCKAKNPAACRFHGNPLNGVRPEVAQMYKEYVASQVIKTKPMQSTNPAINSALQSPLKWEGVKPSWWDEYVAEAEANPFLPVSPELIDIIDSPVGQLAVVWQEESHSESDINVNLSGGFNLKVCYLKSVDTGEILGHLNMGSVTEESFERSFGDDEFSSFRWGSRFLGRNYGFDKYNDDKVWGDRNLTGDALLEKRREVWVKYSQTQGNGLRDSEGKYVSAQNITKEHLPSDEVVKKDLKKFTAVLNNTIESRKSAYDTPFVDYSNVEDSIKGKGLGTALYVYSARMLAKQNQTLRGSGVQSDDAQEVWGRFRELFPKNVKTVDLEYSGTISTYSVFDFR